MQFQKVIKYNVETTKKHLIENSHTRGLCLLGVDDKSITTFLKINADKFKDIIFVKRGENENTETKS